MISESKLDNSFPDGQFAIDGFGKPFRLDRNRNGGIACLFEAIFLPKSFLQLKILLKIFMLH